MRLNWKTITSSLKYPPLTPRKVRLLAFILKHGRRHNTPSSLYNFQGIVITMPSLGYLYSNHPHLNPLNHATLSFISLDGSFIPWCIFSTTCNLVFIFRRLLLPLLNLFRDIVYVILLEHYHHSPSSRVV